MKFDGYGATIRSQELAYVVDALVEATSGIAVRGRPMRRYPSTVGVHVGNRMAAWVGLDATSGAIYVEGKGETTPVLVEAIRGHFPDHSAPRIDVAEDYDTPGAFDALQALIRAHKGPKVKAGYVALPDDVQDGRTWAAGVRGGVAYIREYEAGKHPDRVHMGRPDWVRVEAEVRPHYARDKAAAARMLPRDVWGLTAWTHRVGEALMQSPVTRFEPVVRQYSHDKTTRYIALQFRRHIAEMRDNGEDFYRTCEDVWREEDESFGKRH